MKRLIHGHTRISRFIESDDAHIRAPMIYADERCINVDGGMSHAGRGFVYRL